MTSVATVKLQGIAPYSQSFQHNTPKLNKELADDYERRTWRNKMHHDKDGHVIMPAMSFKNSLADAAKFLGMQIPGKGKSTYTKHFESGILVTDSPKILINGAPVHYEEVDGRWLNVPSDGVSGSGKRVSKCFPIIPMGWEVTVDYLVLDDVITPEVFRDTLVQCGQLIGLGTFRVRNRGTHGRFRVQKIEWNEYQSQGAEVPLFINGVAA